MTILDRKFERERIGTGTGTGSGHIVLHAWWSSCASEPWIGPTAWPARS